MAAIFAYRDMRLAGRLMLALEAMSVLTILVLAVFVLARITRRGALSAAPFFPAADFGGWSGVGYAMVFCVLSFAGFEGAATLGEETHDPLRNIPSVVLCTCIGAGLFYVFVAYAQVMGFGVTGTKDLANASASLNDLAVRYLSRNFATAIDIGAAISAFSCVLASLSAAARLLFALGRAGLSRRIGNIHDVYGTPASAVVLGTLICVFTLGIWMPFTTPANYSGYLLTIGTLALIVVYIGVAAAGLTHALGARRRSWALCGLGGVGVLCWPLYNSLYPAPAFPNNGWPYVVAVWVVAGATVPVLVPAVLTDGAETRDGGPVL